MNDSRHEIELRGCAPVPLAHYLKALGILRLVAEQVDPEAQGWWDRDVFRLRSQLDEAGLVEFFLENYSPTPLVGPWGARSGFFASSSERTARAALERIEETDDPRLEDFRAAIRQTREVLRRLNLESKADNDEDKLRLMQACRSMFSDNLLQWLDAVYVLLNDTRAFPPLLGTGGNEGSGSYMSGFAQEIVTLLIERRWDHAAGAALFGNATDNVLDRQTPGHFSPDGAGGPNAGTGFEGSTAVNPWEYVLILEGALLFAASAVKRLEDHTSGTLAYPFCVRPNGVGYASAAMSDEGLTRAEMWFPVWTRPAHLTELQVLLGEGRATVNRRHVRNGTDFARAVATLGTDRGVSRFERYAFQQRNGLSNFAIHLGGFSTDKTDVRRASLIDLLDPWLDRFRSVASKENAPARAGRALRQLESAILDLCSYGRKADALAVLIALGEVESAVAVSPRLRDQVSPLPLLKVDWLTQTYDKSPEFRLAASLASLWHRSVGPMRRHLEPVDPVSCAKGHPRWDRNGDDPAMVWGGGNLVRNLNAVLRRRIVDVLRTGSDNSEAELLAPLDGRCPASPGDIAAFIDGRVNDRRIEVLLRGLMLLDWRPQSISIDDLRDLRGPHHPLPDAAWALLKLCHLPFTLDDVSLRLTPAITMRATSGDGPEATRLAARRLRSSGLPPAVEIIPVQGDRMRRIAAALVFPIDMSTAGRLRRFVLRRSDQDEDEVTTDTRPAEST